MCNVFCDFCVFCVVTRFLIFVITFEPIEVQTCSAPQNDRLNFSFVKDIEVVGKKMARNGRKTDFYQLQILGNTLYDENRIMVCCIHFNCGLY